MAGDADYQELVIKNTAGIMYGGKNYIDCIFFHY